MIIRVDVERWELNDVDLSRMELEELIWENIGDNIDPQERLNIELEIRVFG